MPFIGFSLRGDIKKQEKNELSDALNVTKVKKVSILVHLSATVFSDLFSGLYKINARTGFCGKQNQGQSLFVYLYEFTLIGSAIRGHQ